ncbi:HIT domain-containing protein [Actinopolymorpha sp. B17G11]|uniref:HIT family protein n=1 Tax=Actinopolymorpha sp. B17G11 TaxID=3160861 RepID=UPI0032E4D030
MVLLDSERWQIVRPAYPLTEAHVALRLRSGSPNDQPTPDVAADLAHVYRAAQAGLHAVLGCDGFGLSFAWSWVPYGSGIGEPVPESDQPTIHVFGRNRLERVKPVRVMALPSHKRPAPMSPAEQEDLDRRLSPAFATAEPMPPPGPEVDPATCDGCVPAVEREQELWRADGVRVLRPRAPLVAASVLVMPLRHVVSPAALHPQEIMSYAERLREVRADFSHRHGSTGLSCFLNDGTRAGQETPHVHVHVFGRAVDEPQNPFEVLARRIGARGTLTG